MAETKVDDFMGELGAGTFQTKLGLVLSEAALGTILYATGNKKGKVTVEFTMQQVGDNNQVIVSHKLVSSVPTKRGKKSEEDVTETPFYVAKGGVLSANPPKEEFTGQFGLVSSN